MILTKSKVSIFLVLALSSMALSASVDSIKKTSNRSILLEDSVNSTSNNPGFITNDLGQNYKPSVDASQVRGTLNNVTLGSSVNGSPGIHLANTRGTNKEINDRNNASKPIEYRPPRGVWMQVAVRSSTSTSRLNFKLPISTSKMRPKKMRFDGRSEYAYNGGSKTYKVGSMRSSTNKCGPTSTKGSYCNMKITGTSYVTGCTGNQAVYYTAVQSNRGCGYNSVVYRNSFKFRLIEVMY